MYNIQTINFTESTKLEDIYNSLRSIEFDPNENKTDRIYWWMKILYKNDYKIKINYCKDIKYYSLQIKRNSYEYVKPCKTVQGVFEAIAIQVLELVTNPYIKTVL